MARSPRWRATSIPHHEVAIADLVLAQSSVRRTVEELMEQLRPDLVGLSVMTFQRATARRVIALIRSLNPDVRIVVGGYDPSLAPDAWAHPDLGVDAIVRGEGDVTFRELVRAIENGRPLGEIPGLLFRDGGALPQDARIEKWRGSIAATFGRPIAPLARSPATR